MEILIIDDSRLSRAMFKRALGQEHTYYEAGDGNQGIELYFIKRPQIVILDLTMPEVSGFEVLEQIMKLDPAARVIVGSADIQKSSQDMARDLGASAFIFKPFTEEGVRNAVQAVLEDSGTDNRKSFFPGKN